MNLKNKIGIMGMVLLSPGAWGMEVDWSGQFRTEAHYVKHYSLDSSGSGAGVDPSRLGQGGYYIPGGGEDTAHFQALFLRLNPKLVVNDNIYIKSEWWLGDPVYGFFGNATPYSSDQRQFFSTQSRGAGIIAQRFWGEFLTDIGTLHLGRAPLHWGLGLFWNAGDGLWDRYVSTGDVIRMVSKFGAFSVIPSAVKYSAGNNIAGACNVTGAATCAITTGSGSVADYSLALKYENPDEEFEGGVNFIKRIAGAAQDPNSGYLGVGNVSDAAQRTVGMNFNTWDLYARKKFGRLTLAGEVPIVSGSRESGGMGGLDYQTTAFALEGNWKLSDAWDIQIRTGHAPGQPNIAENAPSQFKAYFFNPNYKLGLILLNYQLANFAGPNTQNNPTLSGAALASPYYNPIVNENYLSLGGSFQTEKWNFHTQWIFTKAIEAATAGTNFYNPMAGKYFTNTTGMNQSNSLGWEMDYGTTFQWDDHFQFSADVGWAFPGDFYKFSNTSTQNATSTIFATVFRAGVVF